MSDPQLRRACLEFEIALDAVAADEVGEEDWGRAFLSLSLPLIWDASYIALERPGLGMARVEALADRVLGGAGFAHRTVVVVDEADGRRLAEEAEAVAGWGAECTRYMVWRASQPATVRTRWPDPGKGANGAEVGAGPSATVRRKPSHPGESANGAEGVAAREAPMATVAESRRRLMLESVSVGADYREATATQMLEFDRRLGEAGGDRWFVAPDDGPAASVCRLLRDDDGTGQIEDVATLESARRRGLATAVVSAALAASREAGDTTTFITADAADWPQFLYEKLGFVPIGTLHVLRRQPT